MLEPIELSELLKVLPDSLPCFPCLASKAPACPGGYKAATTNPEALRGLWRRYPGPLIGVPTGEPSGVAVLDLDTTKHAEAAEWLERHKARLPVTRVHQTRSGGWHVLFQHKPGLRNSAGKIAPGVDVRANGGYVIWWPSAGLPVFDADHCAPWPDWIEAPAPQPRVALPSMPSYERHSDAYSLGALRSAVARVASAAAGQRNSSLNAEAFAMARFIKSGALDASTIAEALAYAAASAGLTPPEIAGTLKSAMGAGAAQ
jgi:hypothetical protein